MTTSPFGGIDVPESCDHSPDWREAEGWSETLLVATVMCSEHGFSTRAATNRGVQDASMRSERPAPSQDFVLILVRI
jgi:hypothetical protein